MEGGSLGGGNGDSSRGDGGRGEGTLGGGGGSGGGGGGGGFWLTVQLVVAAAWSLVHSSALMALQSSCMHRYCWLHPARAYSPFTDTVICVRMAEGGGGAVTSTAALIRCVLACSLKYQRPVPDAGSNTHAVVALAATDSTVVAWAQPAGPVAKLAQLPSGGARPTDCSGNGHEE